MTDPLTTPRTPSEVATRPAEAVSQSQATIGPYRVLQSIGEGGMGQVWRAEQIAPVRRQVALKLLKAGMDTAHVIARFEAERQALAVMDHPAIARVFDAGATPEGRPYFAMEYVPGEPITTYCNRHRLPTRERLDLFLKVCDGVHHAQPERGHPSRSEALETRMNNLALLYQTEGKLEQSEPLLSRALGIRRRVSGDEHPETRTLMNNLASQYFRRGLYAEAGRLFSDLIAVRRRVLGQDHPNTLIAMNNLATVYRAEGKYAEDEPIFVDVLEMRRRVLGVEHPDTLRTLNALAGLFGLAGRPADAEAHFTKVLDARRRAVGADHPDTLSTMSGLGRVQLLQAKYKEAATTLAAALKAYERALPKSWERYKCQALLGASLAGERKYQEAEPLLVSGYDGMAERRATMPPDGRADLQYAGAQIVQLYGALKKRDKVAEWAQRVQQSSDRTHSKPH